MRLLFVDDNSSAREIARIYFHRQGYGLDTANGVEEAKRKIATGGYEVVVTDEMMPDENGDMKFDSGVKLAEWIYDNYPEIRVVFASVYWERAMKAGHPFIKKPLTPEKLFSFLNEEQVA